MSKTTNRIIFIFDTIFIEKVGRNMNIFICDDNKSILDYISNVINTNYKEFKIYTYSNYEEIITNIKNKKVDILIMDIVLNDNTGINIVKENQNYLSNTQVIYITAYDDYIEDCFETNLTYILRKPINEEKLLLAINKALSNINDLNKSIMVKIGKDNKKINIKDINYIESEGRIIKINLSNDIIKVYGKISDIDDQLGSSFVRIHKSYLVNMNRIINYNFNKVKLDNGKVLPISRSYNKSSKEIIFNYLKECE